MSRSLRHGLVVLAAGALFGAGLAVGGMTEPRKVLAFLDFAGDWDPSLLFVMGGAVAIYVLAYRWTRRRAAPLLAERFTLPARRDLDVRLWLGAGLFGIGWGLGGYCPGPGVVSLGAGSASAAVFVAAMAIGMVATAKLEPAANDG